MCVCVKVHRVCVYVYIIMCMCVTVVFELVYLCAGGGGSVEGRGAADRLHAGLR